MHIHSKGFWAEIWVMLYYLCSLHYLIAHRHKHKLGEVDLIFSRGKTLIFVEVKSRKKGLYEEIISHSQRERITRAAQAFIANRPCYYNYDIRFDLAVVKPYNLPQIIKNAW